MCRNDFIRFRQVILLTILLIVSTASKILRIFKLMNNNSFTICYFSDASASLSNEDINSLFDQVNTFNNTNEISGILLFGMGKFFQVLEGDETLVKGLFTDHIMNDTRHSNIFTVIEKSYDEPIFKNYSSQFNSYKEPEDLTSILSYLRQNRTNSTHNKLERLLSPFGIPLGAK